MKLIAGLSLLFVVGGCASDPGPAIEQTTQDTLPTPIALGKQCAYKGGCDGDIHPTSGTLEVDGKDCAIDGAAATMHMSPNGMLGDNPGWYLESAGGVCGAFMLAGAHLDPFPQTGTTAWGNKHRVELGGTAASQATITSGPSDYEPKAIRGTATIDGHDARFTVYFGDENSDF